jgi:hypothetical protein
MLLAVLSAICFHATAQITIPVSTFPAVGDTFRYAVDLNPTNLDLITPPGGNQQWDYSALKVSQTSQTLFLAPSAGNNAASFPGADLLIKNFGGGETYYNVTTSKVELMGFTGGAAVPFAPNAIGRYNPALVDRRAPLDYGNATVQVSNLTIPFAVSDLPPFFDSLLAGIPGGQFIDSVRVKVRFDQADTVDAWGSLKIPGLTGPVPVLREKLVEKNTTTMEARITVPFPFWIDITGFLGGSGFGDLLGSDSTITYRFLSDVHKEELVSVTANFALDTIQTVRFKNIPQSVSAPEIGAEAPGTASVQAVPNPAIDWVRFECVNLPNDEYTLKIFNIVGKVVWKETFQTAGKRIITVDLENFNKGTYLYSLVNRKGDIIGTKRLVVVKP